MRKFLRLLDNSKLVKDMPFTYGIFGGAVRSWILGRDPRDIDIAVDCTQEQLTEYILDVVSDKNLSSNRFGGFKFKDAGYEFDMWPLAETWAIKNEKIEPTFENLSRYASFNADCIVMEVSRNKCIPLHDFGFAEAANSGIVEVNYAPNPIAPYNAMRGLRICKTYNWKPGKSLLEYVKEHVNEKNKPILELRYKKSYGEEIGDLWKMVE